MSCKYSAFGVSVFLVCHKGMSWESQDDSYRDESSYASRVAAPYDMVPTGTTFFGSQSQAQTYQSDPGESVSRRKSGEKHSLHVVQVHC